VRFECDVALLVDVRYIDPYPHGDVDGFSDADSKPNINADTLANVDEDN
jgi:hypothetical protein